MEHTRKKKKMQSLDAAPVGMEMRKLDAAPVGMDHMRSKKRKNKKMRKLDAAPVGMAKMRRNKKKRKRSAPLVEEEDSTTGRTRSIFVVATHWHTLPGYSLYKADLTLSGDGCSPAASPQRLYHVARLNIPKGGRSFASVRSRQGAWIVAVGGPSCDTFIYDTDTGEPIHGPDLAANKWCPILTSVGDKIYALSREPCVKRGTDFVPWFEVLDLSEARVVAGRLEGCSWKALPRPPCFPWKLTPFDYTLSLDIFVNRYVVVGRYILISLFAARKLGTWSFDTDTENWHKLDDMDLPFIGCAIPHHGFFLGLTHKNPLSVKAYCINVVPASSSLRTSVCDDHSLKLSITALNVNYTPPPGHRQLHLCSLDKELFCSLSWSAGNHRQIFSAVDMSDVMRIPTKICVNFSTYQLENPALLGTLETLLDANTEMAVSNQWEQAFKICSLSRGFCAPPIASVLSI